jgi:hypothetical protein
MVMKLSKDDGAVLVRELAREILPALAPALKPAGNRSLLKGYDTPKSSLIAPKKARRTASETSAMMGPNSSILGLSMGPPPTSRMGIERAHSSSRHRLGDISWQSHGGQR